MDADSIRIRILAVSSLGESDMKGHLTAMAAVLGITVVSGLLVAQETERELVPMAYINVPLGGGNKTQSEPVYGLSLGYAQESGQSQVVGDRHNKRPPILDLQFKARGVNSLKLGGSTLMQRVAVHNADGTVSSNFSMQDITPNQWAIIGLGTFGILCASKAICDKDDKDNEPKVIVVDDFADTLAPE